MAQRGHNRRPLLRVHPLEGRSGVHSLMCVFDYGESHLHSQYTPRRLSSEGAPWERRAPSGTWCASSEEDWAANRDAAGLRSLPWRCQRHIWGPGSCIQQQTLLFYTCYIWLSLEIISKHIGGSGSDRTLTAWLICFVKVNVPFEMLKSEPCVYAFPYLSCPAVSHSCRCTLNDFPVVPLGLFAV